MERRGRPRLPAQDASQGGIAAVGQDPVRGAGGGGGRGHAAWERPGIGVSDRLHGGSRAVSGDKIGNDG
ncbi:hypothetical protein FAIPA1_50233 [Frankia sp. AiPs1]